LSRPVIQLAQDRAWRPVVHGGVVEEMGATTAAAAPQSELEEKAAG
jgi:hypothetical protein